MKEKCVVYALCRTSLLSKQTREIEKIIFNIAIDYFYHLAIIIF